MTTAAANKTRILIGVALIIAVTGALVALNPESGGDSTIEATPGPADVTADVTPDRTLAVEAPDSGEEDRLDPIVVTSDEDLAPVPTEATAPQASADTDAATEPPPAGETPAPSTQAPTPQAPTSPADDAQATAQGAVAGPGRSTDAFESIRNRQDKFSRFGSVPSAQLSIGSLTEPTPKADNGSSPEGQFRVACEYSHFGEDDPIIFPGQPGRAHLHMFFGNTLTNASTTEESLINTGGGTCSGFELNRSAYWTPALLDGKGNTVVPYSIILYYKTKFPGAVSPMPQGLQMIAGNFDRESFDANHRLHWSCGGSGSGYNLTNRIPDCGGDYINATIQFPSCWDGVNLGSTDFVSHLNFGDDNAPCPSSHPVRLPRITILLYFSGTNSVDGWHLASDNTSGFNGPPGGTLHADWWGAWNDEAMNLWINGCMKASRNCSFGQTGTSIQLAGISNRDVYEGQKYLPLPG